MYKKIKDILAKHIVYTGLAALTLTGCPENNTTHQEQRNEYEFDSFGRAVNWYGKTNVDHIAVGDMDGDGDLDMIISDPWDDRVYIIENKMPQKSK